MVDVEIDWTKVKAGLTSVATGFSTARNVIPGAENIATGLRIIASAIIDVAEEEKRTFKQKKDDFVAALSRAKTPAEVVDLIRNTPVEIRGRSPSETILRHARAIFPEKTDAQLNDENDGYRE